MKNYPIDDLMVPLSEYATVTVGATLYEAILALEKAQEDFDQTKYRHRAVLVLDRTGKVVGKISQHAALRALEPQYLKMASNSSAANYGFSVPFLKDLQEQYSLLDGPLENICKKAAKMKVENFMTKLTEGEFIDSGASLDQAIHLLVMGHHQSLLVKKDGNVVGVLRLTDVFASVFHVLKTCE
ncbi:CBS domain-containing protein [uncultured Desulfosarcina sp.]|uniref:CBS domain-containing protein n=1 Tax=uncultured Desulfosarcina sp. TaxID=218289 RepID=UPI0029C779A7|nr:CBS domain-containing protein [uncultured Desulfosarcina sp.]